MSITVENCHRYFRFKCPKHWLQLRPTAERDVRYCDKCHQNVYLCTVMEELPSYAGRCVALVDQRFELAEMMGDIEEDPNVTEEEVAAGNEFYRDMGVEDLDLSALSKEERKEELVSAWRAKDHRSCDDARP